VLYSLFEEQLTLDRYELEQHLDHGTDSFAEALTFFPARQEYRLGPEEYLEHIRKAKAAVKIPILASLNGASIGGWTEFARKMEQAGADALELNVYTIPTDPNLDSQQVEQTYLHILKAVKTAIQIPVAIKLSPFFTNTAHMARRLDEAGADALVLFNRFYQPDVDLEELEIRPNLILSTPQELRLPLTWIGILYGHVKANLAATSGVHRAEDALKVIMVGANVAMMTSALLKNGIDHLRVVEQDMRAWMESHEYESVKQMRGSMSQANIANPSMFERAQYMRTLTSYKLSKV
jgi:dihydroorotate dehydrogenase (fumarate)